MAWNTSAKLRNTVIYSVFPRNYSEDGTLEAVRRDLPRIRDLGTDILWLMPIHPIGEKNRKGTLGSPYAISDYRAVNPEYGTLGDLKQLVEEAHALGMKVIIDVVYNHTSPDSVLREEHPEWFYHKADGSFGNKVGDWWDVIDLDYANPGLWEYQIETLKMWAEIVDGFRCDVASVIPVEFWERAREAVAQVRPDAIWLAESVEAGFIEYLRSRRIPAWSDAELYAAFDMEYEYDVYEEFYGFLKGERSLVDYCGAINRQESIYPDSYVKARYLENHDRPRIRSLIRDERILRNWLAFQFFQKGSVLLYAGQEAGCTHQPSLFDRDPVDWKAADAEDGADFCEDIRKLAEIKHDSFFAYTAYHLTAVNGQIAAAVHTEKEWLPEESAPRKGNVAVGIFCLGEPERAQAEEQPEDVLPAGQSAAVSKERSCWIPLGEVRTGDGRTLAEIFPDGDYADRIGRENVEIRDGKILFQGEPLIFFLQ